MVRTFLSQLAARRRRTLVVLAALALLITAAMAQAAAPGRPGRQDAGTDPATEPTPPATAAAGATTGTQTMTDTIRLVLDAYLAANANPLTAANGPVEIVQTHSASYMPIVRRAAASPTPTATPQPSTTPEPERHSADIAMTLWPDPSIRVARGAVVAYSLRVANSGKGHADRIDVVLPYNRQHLTLVSAAFDASRGDWVREVSDTRVTVTFGPLDEDTTRSGTLYFRANAGLPNDTILDMRAHYGWDDARGGRDGVLSNWAPVLVGGSNDSAPWVWLKIDPVSGVSGTTHTVISNRYLPNENVVTWLNTPQGVRPFGVRGTADGFGNVMLRMTTTGLAPGTYQIVVYGLRSTFTGVTTFVVL